MSCKGKVTLDWTKGSEVAGEHCFVVLVDRVTGDLMVCTLVYDVSPKLVLLSVLSVLGLGCSHNNL